MTISANQTSKFQKTAFVGCLLLVGLCIAWEWFLAPLRSDGSWLILKAVPLALLLPGIYKGNTYQLQVTSMVILIYLFEGLSRILEKGPAANYALLEVVLGGVIFYAVLMHLRPIKQAAKARKAELESRTAEDVSS